MKTYACLAGECDPQDVGNVARGHGVRSDQLPVNNLPPSSTTAPGVVLPPASMQSYLPPKGKGDSGLRQNDVHFAVMLVKTTYRMQGMSREDTTTWM